jgi:translation initiation factor 1
VNRKDPVRLVFSTEAGRICATCGWPASDCRCSRREQEPVPEKPVAKLRLEMKGRGGKTVTVVDGLPRNEEFLTELAHALKKACGTGGTVRDGSIELQGDHRERLAALLLEKGFRVKGVKP